MLQVLAHRTYRHLFAAQVLSLIGTGLTTVALGLLAYDLAGENAGAVLGTALALKMVAYVGIAPIAGAFADRVPRRSFLVGLDLCRASLVLLLPFVTEIWQIYVLVFAFQSFSAAFTPTFQATIPDILPDEKEYTNALSLSRLAYDLESLLSPLLAGLLLTIISYHWLFIGTTLGFLASAALVVSVALPAARAVAHEGGIYRRITRGIRIYLATPRLRGLLALSFAVSSAGAMVIVNTVVYVREVVGGTDRDVAMFLAAYGLGSMVVALILPRLLDRIVARTAMVAGAVMLGAVLLVAFAQPPVAMALALWALLGAGASLILTPSGLLLRRSSRAEDRPALFSAQFALSHACWLVAYPVAGWIGASLGLDVAFVVMAVGALIGAGAALAVWPSLDPDVIEHEHPEMWHDHPHVHDEHHQHAHEGHEGDEPHRHGHRHKPMRHAHVFVIDDHHPVWPKA
ncbi:MFS transporter [Lutibaculum baratangense]|uniref:Putative NreB protein n=1 Tax=Lutibaculum baratangense AMV1 TaxID=631454 RepID=V4RF45_9HYPH|nr:MFS transporter [Lutibaculum baratangense]ESR23989.1 putative NreB protein [Lutibaculum baratangense AMV1]